MKFRGVNSLDIEEPTEPGNICWENIEIPAWERNILRLFSIPLSGLTLLGAYLLIEAASKEDQVVSAVTIGLIDVALPYIYQSITYFECHLDVDDKLGSLLFKLVPARVLTSVFFKYTGKLKWDEYLNTRNILDIMYIQLATCFASPIFSFLDLYNLTKKYIFAPIFSKSQRDYNGYWKGSEWDLAERYSSLSKVIFVTLFYSLLIPLSYFVCAGTLMFAFYFDRFMLFCRWIPAPMMDSTLALYVRRIGLISVVAHMYVSSRLLYSWPMDSAYFNPQTQSYEVVNKYPSLWIHELGTRSWHTDTQKSFLGTYLALTILVVVFTAIYIPGRILFKAIRYLFINENSKNITEASNIPLDFSDSIHVYCPTISSDEERFICADIRSVLPQHRPVSYTKLRGDADDLSVLVPEHLRTVVLSQVKHYSRYP